MNHEVPTGLSMYAKSPSGIEVTIAVPIAAHTADAIADYCAALDRELKAKGFTRSDRLDKPAPFTRGQQPAKPEVQPPADLVIQEHCGLPMKYIPERAKDDGSKIPAHWDCRKGRGCEAPREVGGNKYPFTNWHLTKKPAKQADDLPLKPMTYGAFLTAALSHGFNKLGVLELAQTDEEHLKAMSEDEWMKLIDRMDKVTA